MFDPNTITTQQSQVQYGQPQQQQQTAVVDSKELVKVQTQQTQQEQKQQTFSGFCYTNVNMIHKIEPSSDAVTHNSTVNMSQLTDDKCYITQPFSYNYALVNQMSLAQTNISNITFKCDVCGLMFAHLSLLNHHKRIHQQQQQQQPEGTQQITVQVQQQPQQIQIVSADRISEEYFRYSCDECGLTFLTQNDLKTHRLQSHAANHQQAAAAVVQQQGGAHAQSIKMKNCDSCGTPLPQDSNKKRAIMKVKCETCLSAEAIQPQQIFVVASAPADATTVKFEETAATQPQQQQQQQPTPQQQQQQANIGTQNTIPIGVKNHHPVKRRGVASVTKCTKCNGSGIIFIGGAKNQQSNVEKPFHCNICNGSFSRYSSLWSHKRLHSGEKNFKCNICGLAFAKAAYLKNHSRIHTGEKPYRCNVCGMQFSQSPHLKNHERIHSGERPYVCEVCDKSFARHSTLWNHRRIHTGEKPYRCDICGSCFNQATHLKNHAKVHSGEKPFKCDICSVGFSDRFALKRHRNIHEKYGRTKPAASNANTGGGGNAQTTAAAANNATAAGAQQTAAQVVAQQEAAANAAAAAAAAEEEAVAAAAAAAATTTTEVMVVEPKYEAPDMTEISELQVQLS